MIRRNKLDNFGERILGDRRPITADLFITERCMAKCGYCIYKNGGDDMDMDKFSGITLRLRELGVLSVILTGGGEPLIHPRIYRIIEMLREGGFKIGLNTNLIKYDRALYELIGESMSWVKVGFDGWDRKSYKLRKGVDKYLDVKKNIKRLRDMSNVSIGVQNVVENGVNVWNYYNCWKDNKDVTYIVFRPWESVEDYYNVSEVLRISRSVEDMKKKDNRVVKNFKWLYTSTRFDNCLANWSVLSIDPRGDVLYCCHKVEEIVGNVMDRNILEKKKNYKSNMKSCLVPCRLTGNIIEQWNFINNDSDWMFV